MVVDARWSDDKSVFGVVMLKSLGLVESCRDAYCDTPRGRQLEQEGGLESCGKVGVWFVRWNIGQELTPFFVAALAANAP